MPGKAFGGEYRNKREEQERGRQQENKKKEEKRWRKEGNEVVGDGVVGAGTGNVLEKYFQSFVICFSYKAYGLH